ncbi:MAG: ACT domain-containing protein [Lachnospiraceae bacterium]|nr:ACT domain-containing protein [Lachnospiraceae bacterium]
MELELLRHRLTVCKVVSMADIDPDAGFYFLGKTDEEISLVCKTEDVPNNTIEHNDGWRGFRIQGILDFSLIGVLAKISAVLADEQIGIFVVSTYNTDYILVREDDLMRASEALKAAGYHIAFD